MISIVHNDGAKSAPRMGVFARIKNNLVYDFSRRNFMNMWRDVPMTIRFRCTNKCDEKCARCFECSGPNNPLTVLPADDIAFYENAVPRLKSVYISGGEWSLIYDTDPDYMLRIFDAINLQNADAYAVQTNCRWVFGPNSDKIYADLQKIQDKLGAAGKVLKLDVSVDRFRSQAALNGVRELICRIGADNNFQNTKIRIMSSRMDRYMANDTVLQPEYFDARGVKLRFEPRSIYSLFFQVFYVNDKRMVIHEENPTMRIGRAAQNKIGYKILDPEQQCGGLAGEKFMELSFREDGTVKWHSYYDWNIITPYKDASGQHKSIEQIKQELLNLAWRKHLKQSLINNAWGIIPIIGIMRDKFRVRQMQESYKKNQAAVTLYAREI